MKKTSYKIASVALLIIFLILSGNSQAIVGQNRPPVLQGPAQMAPPPPPGHVAPPAPAEFTSSFSWLVLQGWIVIILLALIIYFMWKLFKKNIHQQTNDKDLDMLYEVKNRLDIFEKEIKRLKENSGGN